MVTGCRRHAMDARSKSPGSPEMNTTELVAKIAEVHSVSKAQAKSMVEDIFKDIVDAAASGATGVRQVQGQGDRGTRRAQSGEWRKDQDCGVKEAHLLVRQIGQRPPERLSRSSAKRQEVEQHRVLRSGPELVASPRLEIEPFLEFDLRDRPRWVQIDPLAPGAPYAAPPSHKRQILKERRLDREDVKSRHVPSAVDPFEHENLKMDRIVRVQGHETKLRRNIRSRPTNDRNRSQRSDSDFESIARWRGLRKRIAVAFAASFDPTASVSADDIRAALVRDQKSPGICRRRLVR